MTLSQGRTYLAIPGPSVMPDAVLQAMHRPAPNIYFGELLDLTKSLVPDLKMVAGTTQNVAMYIANGHAMWEASLMNVLSRGDKVLSLDTGRFGQGWAHVARTLGVQVDTLGFGRAAPVDPDAVAQALKADTDQSIKAVLLTHADTATSVRNDVAAVRAAMNAAGHPALLAVDAVASLACDRLEMDAWGVDIVISASQKGLMTPPGMGFIWFSDKARAVGAEADLRTPYWDWNVRADAGQMYEFFNGTSPTHHLYGLRTALDMIKAEGMDAVYARHETLARAYWAAIDAWGANGVMRHNIADEAARSHAVTTVRMKAPHGTRIREWMMDNMGITLGIPLGMEEEDDPASDGTFRIGHMGHLNAHMVLGNIGALEAAMTAMGIPIAASGVAAASAMIADRV